MRFSRYTIRVADADGSHVLYNTATTARVRLGAAELQRVERFVDGGPPLDPELARRLEHGWLLVPDELDEPALLRLRYRGSRVSTDRLGLTIVTSLGCNFDCPYCYEAKHPELLRPRVQEALLAFVEERLPRTRSLAVSWFGGEPLVGKRPLLELSDAFLARCDAAGVEYRASIVTNGYLLDADTCDELAARRVSNVQVTLDGPADVHDRMRPLAGGGGTFARILDNLREAVERFDVVVRVNVDAGNAGRLEELLDVLEHAGLSGKLGVGLGHLLALGGDARAPSARYTGARCLTRREFAEVRERFAALAEARGFGAPALPRPLATPCTAVRANELVVGSGGELYKCVETVGNPREVVGNILDYDDADGRLRKWLAYDPFSDEECSSCIALPVCMGGCAYHALDADQRSNRCSTFRHTYRETALRAARA